MNTAATREALRAARLGGRRPAAVPGPTVVPLDLRGDEVACAACGHSLAAAGEPWKAKAVVRERPLREVMATYVTDADLVLREHACPACAALLDVEVALAGDPTLVDIIDAPAARAAPRAA